MNPPTSTPRASTAPDRDPAHGGSRPFAESELIASYERLADVFHDVLSELELDNVLDRIAGTVQELIPHDDLAVYEADEAARTLKAVFARGTYADEVIDDEPFAFGRGITGWAVERQESVLANRADLDPRVKFVAGTPPDPESLIAVPLISRGRVKGALNIYRLGLREFTEDEFRLAVRFGDAAALALDNAQVRAELALQAQTDSLTGLWNHRAFHERLRDELVRASIEQTPVSVVMLDLDDFKRVNDVLGHAVGDMVLADLAQQLRAAVRQSDSVCRIGGEEFAVILPSTGLDAATALAARVLSEIEEVGFGAAGRLTISVGVATGPEHAANPRELSACAEVAMMTAKAQGKRRVVQYAPSQLDRPEAPLRERDPVRSVANLKMLHHISSRLTQLVDMNEVGTAVADELRELIDYHNCRVFVRDGDDLVPIAFRGGIALRGQPEVSDLRTRVGVGITGHVAATGEPYLTGDAARSTIGHHIPGTETIDESLLAVPLRYGTRVVGVIVISKLGRDQFEDDDVRLLEVVAGHASIALVNAQLYDAQRQEADGAKALLGFAREMTSTTTVDEAVTLMASSSARILEAGRVAIWLAAEAGGPIECRAVFDAEGGLVELPRDAELEADLQLAAARDDLFIVPPSAPLGWRLLASTPSQLGQVPVAVGPIAVGERQGLIAASFGRGTVGDDTRRSLLAGIAAQARLALANVMSFDTLQRTFLATVEALVNALEAKDEYTSSHARWIRDMALRVGEELGLSTPSLKTLELAALFHDIGKIGIPSEILRKPGPLTPEERAIMEIHPELGERILAPIEQLRDVRPIVRSCHEHFDGNGYPDGLVGEEIPIEARIILVCDAFHAMTTTRPYRPQLSAAEARRRLRAGAGVDFDPAVVDVLLHVLEAPAERPS